MEQKETDYDSIYVFSAEQQEEIKKIYQRYLLPEEKRKRPQEEEEMLAQLRKLDNSVTKAGTIAALLNGLCGAVLHGAGTTLIQNETMFALGTVIAMAGLAIFLASYPVYCFVAKKQRRKVESQILILCDELMK